MFYSGIVFVCMPISIIGMEFENAYTEYTKKTRLSKRINQDLHSLYVDSPDAGVGSPLRTPSKIGRGRSASKLLGGSSSHTSVEYADDDADDEHEDKSWAHSAPKAALTPWLPHSKGNCMRSLFLLFDDPDASHIGKLLTFSYTVRFTHTPHTALTH
jgi:hypothetical protein